MQSSEVRKKFFKFFEMRGHAVVPSSSLIPDDPSVLLTTAGMQQFKPYYTGEADPLTTIHPTLGKPLGLKNAASIQKSFRTSDIDEVGDERHLTFFEMMGNFSFGGYFKEEAIKLAHEFLTNEMGLKIEYITVFEGLDSIGVPEDTESQKIWRALDPDVKIIKQGMDDVFWGPTGSAGPCGPTTEIYCTNEAMRQAGIEPVEIWNIVFNEFFFNGSREELLAGNSGKKLEKLSTPGVDTGMGLERLAMIAQNKKNIFETDLFAPFSKVLHRSEKDIVSGRIIADHIRGAIFLIADGVQPSNKEAGYILRRLIRRAMVHANKSVIRENFLLMPGDLIFELIHNSVDFYGEAYIELGENKNIIAVFEKEFDGFSKTLKGGLREFDVKFPGLGSPGDIGSDGSYGPAFEMGKKIGKEAFDLYQTYGFPIEIIKELLGERGYEFDQESFGQKLEEEKKKHQEISRAGSTAKFGGHGLYMKTGEVTIRDESEVEKVTRLHTATHLMHAALRAVLGPEVRQDGSDITVERTRFDFRFGRKVAPDELKKVEEWVNAAIARDLKVEYKEMAYEEALAKGALGFFKEKYPPRVKVYSMFDADTGEVFSQEFCGGPHVTHTGEVGSFRIVKEESSSAGVRRIRGTVE